MENNVDLNLVDENNSVNSIVVDDSFNSDVVEPYDIIYGCYLMLCVLNFVIIVVFLYKYLKSVFKKRG